MKDLSRSPYTHLGFCTDGHPGQLIGIAGLLRAIFPKLHFSEGVGQVWIATPTARHDFVRTGLNDFVPESRLRLLDVETNSEDRYFVQIGLSEIFRRIDAADYVLCLDYDHLLVRSAKELLCKYPSTVIVSSEVRGGTCSKVESFFGGQTDLQALNTSLIWGQADRLRRIGDRWAECYSELAPFVPKRNLVEYAFGLAAVRTGTKVERCSQMVQGNMFNMNTDCIMFHYGGDDDVSLLLKEELYRQGNACLNGTDFAGAVEEVDRCLRKRIFAIGIRTKSKAEGNSLQKLVGCQLECQLDA